MTVQLFPPATIAMLDNTYEALGQEKISDGVVGVDQDEIDAWTEQIDKSMETEAI